MLGRRRFHPDLTTVRTWLTHLGKALLQQQFSYGPAFPEYRPVTSHNRQVPVLFSFIDVRTERARSDRPMVAKQNSGAHQTAHQPLMRLLYEADTLYL